MSHFIVIWCRLSGLGSQNPLIRGGMRVYGNVYGCLGMGLGIGGSLRLAQCSMRQNDPYKTWREPPQISFIIIPTYWVSHSCKGSQPLGKAAKTAMIGRGRRS